MLYHYKTMSRINYPKSNFDHFSLCSLDLPDDEISRTSIRMRLQDSPKTPKERGAYQAEPDRLTVIKYISRLRRGRLSKEDFSLKVVLTDPDTLLS
jgi:hypothetical protein